MKDQKANAYIYSGTYNIIAFDDGINSAGDTDENCAASGEGEPIGSDRNPNVRPRNLRNLQLNQNQCFIFHIFIYGKKNFY